MEPVWLKNYQVGVPATIDADAYPSLNALFAESMENYKDLPCYANMGKEYNYSEIEQLSRHFAAFLQNKLRLNKGDRFAIMMPNVLQYPIAMLGILRAGCTVVNVNPLYTAEEFLTEINDAQATSIIVLENFAHIIAQVVDKTMLKNIVVAKVSDIFSQPKAFVVDFVIKYIKRMIPAWKFTAFYTYKEVLATGAQLPYTDPMVTGKDIAFLQYTGGTTGVPKGAMLTHRNMVANMQQATIWLKPVMLPGKEIIVTALPLYHIFSLTANCLTFLRYGALNVLITNPRDLPGFIKDLKKYKFTAITGVNTLFNLLLNNPQFASVDFSGLKVALGGGMQVQKIVAERWLQVTHKPLIEAYGLTETSPAACINPLNLPEYNGTIGLPISSTEISIRDDDGKELGFDQPGELWIRGPQVMLGYWHQPEETKNVLTPEGWLKTGDVATVNAQGFVSIVDRKKDLILVSGFKVFPNEVENIIATMPGVQEVAVIGAPDGAAGEMVRAFVVRNDPNITMQNVRAYCRQHLTGYKVPKDVEFRDSLPKSNVGKILRRALR